MTSRPMMRRTRLLAMGEAFNVVFFPVLFLGLVGVEPSLANLVGLGSMVLVLGEGCAYWILKYRQLLRSRPHPRGMVAFRGLMCANIGLLAIGFLVICTGFVGGGNPWIALAFWAFAVLEHINYFHVQLMCDTKADLRRLMALKRPRRSHLAADLARTAPRTPEQLAQRV